MILILSQSHKIARKQELQGLSFFRSSESYEIGMLLTFTTRCYFPTYLCVVGRKLPITTKGTPIETMRYLLDLPSMETRHKVEQVKAYLNAMQNPKNPLHDAVKEEKGCRLARGKSWMGQAEQSIQHVCSLTELKQVRDWEKRPVEFKPYYKTLLSENLGTHCREWPARKNNADVQMLVEANSKPHDIVIYTDGSVTRDRSGWKFTVKQGGRTVHEDIGAHRVTTSSLTMEVETVTHAIQWLASQRHAQITHAVILTDSMNQSSATKTSVDLLSRAGIHEGPLSLLKGP